jgi:serine protease
VSATVALMLDAMQTAGQPAPTPAQIKGFLVDSVRPFPIVPPSGTPIGTGIVNAAGAINLALGNDPGNQATVLINGVPVGNLYGAKGDELLFSLEVPAGAHNLSLRSFGGMGDVSLYVSRGQAPTTASHDYQSVRVGNNESVVIGTPQPGTYYVLVHAGTTFRNLGVLGNYQP